MTQARSNTTEWRIARASRAAASSESSAGCTIGGWVLVVQPDQTESLVATKAADGQRRFKPTMSVQRVGRWTTATRRVGRPVEVQALWLNALRGAARDAPVWRTAYHNAREQFATRFRNADVARDLVKASHRCYKTRTSDS